MSFYEEIAVKAVRKTHLCTSCETQIAVGEPAVRFGYRMDDGRPATATMHPDCRKAEIELNRLHMTRDDEWMGLTDMEWEDHPWLLEAHPAIAARMGITAEKSAATHKEMEECRIFWSRHDAERRTAAEAERRTAAATRLSSMPAKGAIGASA